MRVVDMNEQLILVGAHILSDDSPPIKGTVIKITDPDGDVDDEGRGIQINPRVYVKWDHTYPESWLPTHCTNFSQIYYDGVEPIYMADDAEVINY